jgi:hypothetical protein
MDSTLADPHEIHKSQPSVRKLGTPKYSHNLIFFPLSMGMGIYMLTCSVKALSDMGIPGFPSLLEAVLSSLPHAFIVFALLNSYPLLWKRPSYGQVLFWITSVTSAAIATLCLQGLCISDLLLYEFTCMASMYYYFIANLPKIII